MVTSSLTAHRQGRRRGRREKEEALGGHESDMELGGHESDMELGGHESDMDSTTGILEGLSGSMVGSMQTEGVVGIGMGIL